MRCNAIQCNTMQYNAIPCNTMQYNAMPCYTMQYHASLITADGAYHCPVGSIWLFFFFLTPPNNWTNLCRYSDILKLARRRTSWLEKMQLCWANTKPGGKFPPISESAQQAAVPGGEIGKVFYRQIICSPPPPRPDNPQILKMAPLLWNKKLLRSWCKILLV